jgi:hypothetical protein
MATEMDGLPESMRANVRLIYECAERGSDSVPLDAAAVAEMCDELKRLASENAEMRKWLAVARDTNGPLRVRAERAESELAELKRKIAEAGKAAVHDDANLGPSLVAYMDATDLGKTFALLLLPLDDGGEG